MQEYGIYTVAVECMSDLVLDLHLIGLLLNLFVLHILVVYFIGLCKKCVYEHPLTLSCNVA